MAEAPGDAEPAPSAAGVSCQQEACGHGSSSFLPVEGSTAADGTVVTELVRQDLVRGMMRMLFSMDTFETTSCFGRRPSCFHLDRMPRIGLSEYLSRTLANFGCGDACLVVACTYIERLGRTRPDLKIDAYSMHNISLCSLLAAAKFMEDQSFSNEWYARVGGTSTATLAEMELEFLKLIDWGLNVSPKEYAAMVELLLLKAAGAARATGGAVAKGKGEASMTESTSSPTCVGKESQAAVSPPKIPMVERPDQQEEVGRMYCFPDTLCHQQWTRPAMLSASA